MVEDLIPLKFHENEGGEYIDPVTFKVFTDNTHIVALRNTGNVFAGDTVERLNVKAKIWRDLVDDMEFGRKDIITLQDPQNVGSRDLSSFQYLKDGVGAIKVKADGENIVPEKVLKTKEALEKARRGTADADNSVPIGAMSKPSATVMSKPSAHTSKAVPYNAAQHTTGKAAASFTSTGLTPHTSGERALLTDEEYMLRPRRVKNKGYARVVTNLGPLTLELQTEYAPRAVWNFVQLAKKGYYSGVAFHRNIRNFMIQGGDPTGTGKGGESIWGKTFKDEFDGPLVHDARGVVSMANKGKNTNSSQFFITYRKAAHLDRKHTIFGRVVDGLDVLTRMENAETDKGTDRPREDITIEEVIVFVDPFEEFLEEKGRKEEKEREKEERERKGGREDERVTWTGKRIRPVTTGESEGQTGGVGKYLKIANAGDEPATTPSQELEWAEEQPVKKKAKSGGGFGNFDAW